MFGMDFLKTLLKRWRRVVLMLSLMIVGFFAFTGCTSVIRPPASPEDPVATYLLMDDRHRGVWLPRREGGFVEYGFGDWDWYAENHDSWYHVFDTVLWSTQGALGRRISTSKNGDELRRQFHWMRFYEIRVARKEMEALREQLASAFVEGADQQVYNARYRMHFVPTRNGYWFLHNCNDVVADWLVRLGCSVSWVPIRIDLLVAKRK